MHIDDINLLGPAVRTELLRQMAAQQKQRERKHKPKIQSDDEFESQLEADFYRREVLPKIHSGEIVKCETHKTFQLLPPDEYCGIKLHKAEYTPDFILEFRNGYTEVVEVKSKAVRKLQKSYVYRRRLFIDKFARPNSWGFREVIVD